jgi:ABC-type transport system involved in cytochrome c biogenesis permease subunit
VQRLLASAFGAAGLLAHTLLLARWFLLVEPPVPLSSQAGSLLFLAWILAVFYLFGSLHRRKLSWGVFILPLVLGLVGLAAWFAPAATPRNKTQPLGNIQQWELDWGIVHGALLLLAAVGVCVGSIASVMFLVQARRLKAKALPNPRFRLLSLERLEEMSRRAIILAFPLLTAGLLVGIALMQQQTAGFAEWGHVKIVSTVLLWVVFAILLYLRYAIHGSSRRVALLTFVAFVLLLFALTSAHHFGPEGIP